MRRDAGEFQSLSPYEPGADRHGRSSDRSQTRVEVDLPELRPRSVGELLDLAFEVLRSRFGTYVGLSAALWIPVRIAQPFIGLHRWIEASRPDLPPWGAIFGFAYTGLATAVLTVLEVSLVALLVAAQLEGRRLSISEAFHGALSRLFTVAMIAIVSGLLLTAGWLCFCLLFLPGLYLSWRLYLAPAVCVIENAGIGQSLSRSFELSRGSFLRFLAWFALAIVALLFALPFGMLASLGDNPGIRAGMIDALGTSPTVFDAAMVGFSSLFSGVATAIRGVVVTVWYFDCRARREGIDLESELDRKRTGRMRTGFPLPGAAT